MPKNTSPQPPLRDRSALPAPTQPAPLPALSTLLPGIDAGRPIHVSTSPISAPERPKAAPSASTAAVEGGSFPCWPAGDDRAIATRRRVTEGRPEFGGDSRLSGTVTNGRAPVSNALCAAPIFLRERRVEDLLPGLGEMVDYTGGIPRFYGELWTSRQRQGHALHPISYHGSFKPELPRYFIDALSGPGDLVCDPFGGRGTTALEAALMGRIPIINDVAPLCAALVAPRLDTPSIAEVERRLSEIPFADFDGCHEARLLAFYHPRTLAQIEKLKRYLLAKERAGALDRADAWIRMVTLHLLTGHSPGFLSVRTMPPGLNLPPHRQVLLNARNGLVPPFRDLPPRILKKSRVLLQSGGLQTPHAVVLTGSANSMPEIADGSVTLTVTSPPFLDVIDYGAEHWLQSWFLGIEPKQINFAMHRDLEAWRDFVRTTLIELGRIIRPGGHVAYEVGDLRGGRILLDEHVLRAADGLALRPRAVIVNGGGFSRSSHSWHRGTTTNRIVLFQKE